VGQDERLGLKSSIQTQRPERPNAPMDIPKG
jgi:hypothetical protein